MFVVSIFLPHKYNAHWQGGCGSISRDYSQGTGRGAHSYDETNNAWKKEKIEHFLSPRFWKRNYDIKPTFKI